MSRGERVERIGDGGARDVGVGAMADDLHAFLSTLPGEPEGDLRVDAFDDVWKSLDMHLDDDDDDDDMDGDAGASGAREAATAAKREGTLTRSNVSNSQTYMSEGMEIVKLAVDAVGIDLNTAGTTAKDVSNGLKSVLEDVVGLSGNDQQGCLAQLWMAEHRDGDVVLCCHKEFVRVKATHRADLLSTYHDSWKLFFFNTSLSGTEAFLGAPGRVFSANEPEYTPSTQCYTAPEFSRHILAQQCGIHTSLTVPVGVGTDPSRPLGVLELSFNHIVDSVGKVYVDVKRAIEAHGLCTVESMRMAPREVLSNAIALDLNRINVRETEAALKACCQSLDIPFAQIWIPCNNSSLVTAGAPFYQSSGYFQHYRESASNISVDLHRGVAGKIWSKGSMIWVHDLNTISHRDLPLKHSCILLKMRGFCFVKMALRKVASGEPLPVVLEVQLNPNLSTPREQAKTVQRFWSSIEQRLDAVVCTNTDKSWLEDMKQTQVSNNAAMASLNDDPLSVTPTQQQLRDSGALWGITLEVLQQNFHKHLKQAASDLGVGSTTLKRICRQYGITRWPRRSLNSKHGKLKQMMNKMTGEGAPSSSHVTIDTLLGSQTMSMTTDTMSHMVEGESVHGASAMSFASAGGSLEHSIHGGSAGIRAHPYAAPDGLVSPSGSDSYKRGLEERVHRGAHLGALWGGAESRQKSQRGMSWHGNSSARLALNDDIFTRFEQSVHGTHNFGMPPAPMDQSVHGGLESYQSVAMLREEMANFFDEFVSEPETASLVVKVLCQKDVLRIRLRTASRYDELMATLAQILYINLDAIKIKYQDDEGDWCLLRSQEDFDECLAFSSKAPSPRIMRAKLVVNDDISLNQLYRVDQLTLQGVKSDGATVSVKASVGEDVIRFKLTATMTFAEVQNKCSALGDAHGTQSLEYLDDEDEWVRLGGGVDLSECREVSAATGALRIRIARTL